MIGDPLSLVKVQETLTVSFSITVATFVGTSAIYALSTTSVVE